MPAVHWERRVFLSQPCPLERVTTADRKGKGRKKKRGKKKKEGAGRSPAQRSARRGTGVGVLAISWPFPRGNWGLKRRHRRGGGWET